MTRIIVFGNEKGGTGKSTTAMHVATALARQGERVGAIDLDLRQRSLGRYIENRVRTSETLGRPLPSPRCFPLPKVRPEELAEGETPHEAAFTRALERLAGESDTIVIDCPGAHTPLSRLAHAAADILVTPLNDSFVDFDLLARIDPEDGRILGPSIYSEMVWQARQSRGAAGAAPFDWVVLRNRVGSQNMHNKRKVGAALEELSKRIGFRVAPGFSERVIFRELFPQGLTLLDLKEAGIRSGFSLSHIAARQELRELMIALGLPAGF